MAMMMSAPVPDWIAEVMRDCRSLALTVSSLSVMPVAFLHSCVIGPLSRASEAGTKSAQRSQWMVVSCAGAGARPLARMAARPPACAATAPDADSFKTLRRAMRAMISSRDCCVLELRVIGHAVARRGVVYQLRVSICTNAAGASQPECPAECSRGQRNAGREYSYSTQTEAPTLRRRLAFVSMLERHFARRAIAAHPTKTAIQVDW